MAIPPKINRRQAKEHIRFHLTERFPDSVNGVHLPWHVRHANMRKFRARARLYNIKSHGGRMTLFCRIQGHNKIAMVEEELEAYIAAAHIGFRGRHLARSTMLKKLGFSHHWPGLKAAIDRWFRKKGCPDCYEVDKMQRSDHDALIIRQSIDLTAVVRQRAPFVLQAPPELGMFDEHVVNRAYPVGDVGHDQFGRPTVMVNRPGGSRASGSSTVTVLANNADVVALRTRSSNRQPLPIQIAAPIPTTPVRLVGGGVDRPVTPNIARLASTSIANGTTPPSALRTACKKASRITSGPDFDRLPHPFRFLFTPRLFERFWAAHTGPLTVAWNRCRYILFLLDEFSKLPFAHAHIECSVGSYANMVTRASVRFSTDSVGRSRVIVVPHSFTDQMVQDLNLRAGSMHVLGEFATFTRGPLNHDMVVVCDNFAQSVCTSIAVNNPDPGYNFPDNWPGYIAPITDQMRLDEETHISATPYKDKVYMIPGPMLMPLTNEVDAERARLRQLNPPVVQQVVNAGGVEAEEDSDADSDTTGDNAQNGNGGD